MISLLRPALDHGIYERKPGFAQIQLLSSDGDQFNFRIVAPLQKSEKSSKVWKAELQTQTFLPASIQDPSIEFSGLLNVVEERLLP